MQMCRVKKNQRIKSEKTAKKSLHFYITCVRIIPVEWFNKRKCPPFPMGTH
ncbi:hypothetical protein HMPREF9123_1170 [Neisseria bacilliformis ATCC BAA-1200]|uniref:Uncharacterized protein n=1 Tax=Neisseria bacilliformis ATCC BAA-1200 TaxID=888742 RepID=F2BBR5_9NEIS|nr:hypothetical protein HMPREF9123_1170 [Neisseria bacilliformis ATCC BAA-1200]